MALMQKSKWKRLPLTASAAAAAAETATAALWFAGDTTSDSANWVLRLLKIHNNFIDD